MENSTTDFYRFPKYQNADYMFTKEEIRHLVEEVKETYDEWNKKHFNRVNFGMEIMDVIHVAETLLRMHFSDPEIEEIHRKVLEKNNKRGYYEEEDYLNTIQRYFGIPNIERFLNEHQA